MFVLGSSAEANIGSSANPAFAHIVSCLLSMTVACVIWCLARWYPGAAPYGQVGLQSVLGEDKVGKSLAPENDLFCAALQMQPESRLAQWSWSRVCCFWFSGHEVRMRAWELVKPSGNGSGRKKKKKKNSFQPQDGGKVRTGPKASTVTASCSCSLLQPGLVLRVDAKQHGEL